MFWAFGSGFKATQNACVPDLIKDNVKFAKWRTRALMQTDGCIYRDRGYLMITFTNNTLSLCEDVRGMLVMLRFRPSF